VIGALSLALAVLPAVRASAVPTCDTTSTDGFEARHPYLGREGADALAANPAYSYAQNPYVYTLFVPEGLPDGPVPLLIGLHGLGNSAHDYEAKGLQDLARREGLIVAFPSGARSWWATEDSFDVKFVRDVVADIRAQRCIDPRRIWATGASNGAFMVQRLACDAADVFAAIAAWAATPVDGTYPFGGPCRANEDQAPGFETAPIGFWQGTADETVAFETGRRAMQLWVDRYRCDTVPTSVDSTTFGDVQHFRGCTRADAVARAAATGVPFEVQFRIVNGHPHVYPAPPAAAVPTADDINREIFGFLARHPRSTPAPEQERPDPSDVPMRDPARHADWLAALPDHGPGTSLALVSATGTPVTTADAIRSRSLTVEYQVTASDAPEQSLRSPDCPSTSPGSNKVRVLGRPITLRVTDANGTTEQVAPTVEQPGTGLAVASFTLAHKLTGAVVIEATTGGDRVASPALCTARDARFQQTVGCRRCRRVRG
jgi:poly(3-hydroxybutyrate) depolymerase